MKRLVVLLPLLLACDAPKPEGPGGIKQKIPPAQEAGASDEIKTKFKDSYRRALTWLAENQWETGAWGREVRGKKFPSMGLTSLAVYAIAAAPEGMRKAYAKNIDLGISFMLKHQHPMDDKEFPGAFYEPPGQLRAYVTSISIMVLTTVDRNKYADQINNAVRYLREIQSKEGFFTGGTGYGETQYKPTQEGYKVKQSKAPNMSTANWAADAMHAAGVPTDDEYWKRVAEFVSKMQNSSETNVDPAWIKALAERGYKIGNDGSIVYSPEFERNENYAGHDKNPDGTKTVKGYASMTYGGIKTYLYAGLGKDDPKVKAAIDWCRKNYTLDFHPGFPFEKDLPAAKRRNQQGIYYYYLMMVRCLDAFGETPFLDSEGTKHDWPAEIAGKLMSLQSEKESWSNPNARWWEDQESLVTPYALICYSILAKHLK